MAIERENALPRTTFFRASRGVFEGGGCRGAAHVGAYVAAVECGVRFSEVAGTSAGSIIAALIGAGATTDFLHQCLLGLDFRRFLASPDRAEFESGWIGAFAKRRPLRWLAEKYRLGRIVLYGGAYSSVEIEKWLNELLTQLLPEVNRPVRFCDLVVPTSIVTADLGSGTARIWSTERTPGESVALAVRSSCSIPGLFQPVHVGATRLVDGGLLSNLPAFVFANRDRIQMDMLFSHRCGG